MRMFPLMLKPAAALLAGIILVALVTATGWAVVARGAVVPQQEPITWPTPPPGLSFAVPSAAARAATVVISAAREQSEVAFVPVGWPGFIPLIPPIPQNTVTFAEKTGGAPVRVRVEAGTFSQGVQLRVTPANPAALPAAWQDAQVLWAFTLEVLDVQARPVQEALSRPLRLTMPVAAIAASGLDPRGLLAAQLTSTGWQPLETSLETATQTMTLRLLSFGTVSVVYEPSPAAESR